MATPARAQEILSPKAEAAANRLFELSPQKGDLKCSIEREHPSLDFTFHFDAGYVITCPVRQFGDKRTRITILTRVTPRDGTPVVLGTFAVYRGLPTKRVLAYPGHGKVYFQISGGFSVGEGHYHVEVLVADSRHRTCRRAWWIKVAHHTQRKVPVVVAAHQVVPVQVPTWRGPQRKGLRLAILLSAASFNPRRVRLGAGYQMLLLQILSSLLQQTPCRSVRLVAYNLDQQRVIFRTNSFKPAGFVKLQQAFRGLNLGVVSVQTLQRRNEWPEMLARLTNRQLTAKPPPDAVIFLGRSFLWVKKLPREMLMFHYEGMPEFFYFENGPDNIFSDSLGKLTKSLRGKIYRINTPDDLGKAIQKMLAQLQPATVSKKTSASR